MIISIFDVIIISYGHYASNSYVLYFGLFCFLAIILFSDISYKAPLLLFYLPWIGIMKIRPEANSFYSVAFIIALIGFISDHANVRKKSIFVLILFVIYTLFVKLLYNDVYSMRYIITFMYMYFMAILLNNSEKYVDYYKMVMFFVFGVIIANIAGLYLVTAPHLLDYFKLAEDQYGHSNRMFRYGAFNGDPNRNSAQILMAIIFLLSTINMQSNKYIKIVKYVLILIMIYLGFLSLSKMYIIYLSITLFVWFFIFMYTSYSFNSKIIGVIMILMFCLFIFNQLLDSDSGISKTIIRMESSQGDYDTITTGRLSLQEGYIDEIFGNNYVFLFGRGFLTGYQPIENVSHNTFIQIYYSLGFIGIILYLAFFFTIHKGKKKVTLRLSYNNVYSILAVIILIGICSALDMVTMDAFYYYLILISASFVCSEKSNYLIANINRFKLNI